MWFDCGCAADWKIIGSINLPLSGPWARPLTLDLSCLRDKCHSGEKQQPNANNINNNDWHASVGEGLKVGGFGTRSTPTHPPLADIIIPAFGIEQDAIRETRH